MRRLESTGLGKIRFQDLRHGFGSLLIQGGTSLAYVKEQIGHSSMQVTVDEYGHLIPGANVNWVDRLDREPRLHQTATVPGSPTLDSPELIEKIWWRRSESNRRPRDYEPVWAD